MTPLPNIHVGDRVAVFDDKTIVAIDTVAKIRRYQRFLRVTLKNSKYVTYNCFMGQSGFTYLPWFGTRTRAKGDRWSRDDRNIKPLTTAHEKAFQEQLFRCKVRRALSAIIYTNASLALWDLATVETIAKIMGVEP